MYSAPPFAGDPVAEPEGDAVPAVGRQRADERAVPLRDLAGVVGAAVVDDQQRHRYVGDLLRHLVQDGADVLRLVVGRDHDDQGLKLQVRVGAGESGECGRGDRGRVRRLPQAVIGHFGGLLSPRHLRRLPVAPNGYDGPQ